MLVDVKTSLFPENRKRKRRLRSDYHIAIVLRRRHPSPPPDNVPPDPHMVVAVPGGIAVRHAVTQSPVYGKDKVYAIQCTIWIGTICAKAIWATDQVDHCTRTPLVSGRLPTSCCVRRLRGTSAPTASRTDAICSCNVDVSHVPPMICPI